MKIRIELTDGEDEVVIRCRELSGAVREIQKAIEETTQNSPRITFYKGKEEYFFPLGDVLFFETDCDTVYAHTAAEMFKTDFKLYQLQNFLPASFVRVSKSAIVNREHILSVNKNLASSSLIRFQKSHKQIYVSRLYYKELKQKLTERD